MFGRWVTRSENPVLCSKGSACAQDAPSYERGVLITEVKRGEGNLGASIPPSMLQLSPFSSGSL